MHSRSFSGVLFTRDWQTCSEGGAAFIAAVEGLDACARRYGPRMTRSMAVIDAAMSFSLADTSLVMGTSPFLLGYLTPVGAGLEWWTEWPPAGVRRSKGAEQVH